MNPPGSRTSSNLDANWSLYARAATSCHACGKSGGKLLLCGRCRNVWFCNRDCQVVARQELGHRGTNSRLADECQTRPSSADTEAMSVDRVRLHRRYQKLVAEADKAKMANTRIVRLAAVEKYTEAATVADLIGGAAGADRRAEVDQLRSICFLQVCDNVAAVRAACSSFRAARASGSRTMLVNSLVTCGTVAKVAPGEIAAAEKESREHERCSGSPPSYGGLDLSQEGRISLPTTPAALSRLNLAYLEAAVGFCDAALCGAALAAAGGRDSPAANDSRRASRTEARARGSLGASLYELGEERQRGLELLRQAVALRRQVLRAVVPGHETRNAQQDLAHQLSSLGVVLQQHGFDGMAETEACLREALALCESSGDVWLIEKTLRYLVNMCGLADATVGLAEAEAFRSRLNQLLVQMGRSVETSCSICLEPLAPAADGAEDAADSGDSVGAGDPLDSCVYVMSCEHQFHHGCLLTWLRTTSNRACPLCKK